MQNIGCIDLTRVKQFVELAPQVLYAKRFLKTFKIIDRSTSCKHSFKNHNETLSLRALLHLTATPKLKKRIKIGLKLNFNLDIIAKTVQEETS